MHIRSYPTVLRLAVLLSALAVAGCRSYDIVQSNLFSDEDGNVMCVSYGRAYDEHVNTFRSPTNGKELEFRSRLVVEAVLPDGDSFTAWQCMNFSATGTMYRTDDLRWMLQVNGFACLVFRRVDGDGDRYEEIYRGVLCESPVSEFRPSDKWRKMKKDTKGNWH